MRMPVRLPDGSRFRLDMGSVVHEVESMILSAPSRVLVRAMRTAEQGAHSFSLLYRQSSLLPL